MYNGGHELQIEFRGRLEERVTERGISVQTETGAGRNGCASPISGTSPELGDTWGYMGISSKGTWGSRSRWMNFNVIGLMILIERVDSAKTLLKRHALKKLPTELF